MNEYVLLVIAVAGIVTWLRGEKPKATPPPGAPPRKYPLPDRPENDDPDRWYG